MDTIPPLLAAYNAAQVTLLDAREAVRVAERAVSHAQQAALRAEATADLLADMLRAEAAS